MAGHQRARRRCGLHRYQPRFPARGRTARQPGPLRQRRGRGHRCPARLRSTRRRHRGARALSPRRQRERLAAEPPRDRYARAVRRGPVSRRTPNDRGRSRGLPGRARLGRRAPGHVPPALRQRRRAHLRRGAALSRRAGHACAAALLLFVAGRCLVPMDETDMFFNLRLGEIVLHDHAVPRTNLLSFTYPDAPDVNLAWVFPIVLALAHRAGGIPGTLLLKTIFVLATIAVLFRVAVRRGAHPAAAAAALALSAWAAEPRFVERPHLVTFLGLALTLLALERAED